MLGPHLPRDYVLELRLADHQFLQVLLSRFRLTRQGRGVRLEISIEDDSPAIWTRQAKAALRSVTPDFETKSERYQAQLDDFLLTGIGQEFSFDDPTFYFRFASGGTLPIVRREGQDYYCLFYRSARPIGWNLANGGCDSRAELFDLEKTLDRELREELLIVDPVHQIHYVFPTDQGKPFDRPEFNVARLFWQSVFPEFQRFREEVVPVKWLKGPDSLRVQFKGALQRPLVGWFLNVNAEDFGIEADRVARLNLTETMILCDGEIVDNKILNRPVGLFEVQRFNSALAGGGSHFLPDLFFFDGQLYEDGALVERVLHEEFAPRLRANLPEERQELDHWIQASHRFDLCPVTRRIAQRSETGRVPSARSPSENSDIFLSFASEDVSLAQAVFNYLTVAGRDVFFSQETLDDPDFSRAIDQALDRARSLVVVGTTLDHLTKPWVEYEWRSFHNDINSHLKENARLIPFVQGINPLDLPRPLRHREVIQFTPAEPAESFNRLSKLMA